MSFQSLFTILFCFGIFNTCYGQVTKTIHQTFTLDGAQVVNINIVGQDVNLKETKGSRILIETKVTISLPNPKLLNFVANSGRYDLIKTTSTGTKELTLASKKSNDVIIVKGEECQEILEYVIYLPESVQFTNNSTIGSRE